MNKYFKRFGRFIKSYPYFVGLIVLGIIFVGGVTWHYRPNIYRSPYFKDDTNYSEVMGAVDFTDVYEYLSVQEGVTVKKVNYKADKPYTLKNDPISITVDGYELVELSEEVNFSSRSQTAKGRHLFISKITMMNESPLDYTMTSFSTSGVSDYTTMIRPISTRESFPHTNWNDETSSSKWVKLESNKPVTGYLMYVMNESVFHELYFSGSLSVMSPEIKVSESSSVSVFPLAFREIELPVAATYKDLYI